MAWKKQGLPWAFDGAERVSEGAGRASDRAGRVSRGAGRLSDGAGMSSEGEQLLYHGFKKSFSVTYKSPVVTALILSEFLLNSPSIHPCPGRTPPCSGRTHRRRFGFDSRQKRKSVQNPEFSLAES